MVANLGFVNPSSSAVVIEVNIHSKDKITKITSFVNGIPTYTKLEGLQFNVSGIIKEFPDLKDKEIPEMRKIALQRFKDHLDKMKSEKELIQYVYRELGKSGYIFKSIQKPGFRIQPIKDGRYI